MSLSTMTDFAVSRRGKSRDEVATSLEETTKAIADTASAAKNQTLGTTALKAISAYIPTEIIAIYLAALAVARSTTDVAVSSGELVAFWSVMIATPLVTWAVYAAKVRTDGAKVPINPMRWPIWEMFAATVGFAAWSYAIPDSAWARFDWYSVALGALIILVVSTVLGLISPLVTKPLRE